MQSTGFAAPILPGKLDDWKKFNEEINGPRRSEFEAQQRRLGNARQRVWLQQTPMGDFANRVHRGRQRRRVDEEDGGIGRPLRRVVQRSHQGRARNGRDRASAATAGAGGLVRRIALAESHLTFALSLSKGQGTWFDKLTTSVYVLPLVLGLWRSGPALSQAPLSLSTGVWHTVSVLRRLWHRRFCGGRLKWCVD